MSLSMSERWEPTDKSIFMIFNHTESREAVNITGNGVQIANNTMVEKSVVDLVSGDNQVKNETEFRTFEFVINGKEESSKNLFVQPLLCIQGECVLEAIEEFELEEGQRLWSDPESWGEGGKVPEDGDDVEI